MASLETWEDLADGLPEAEDSEEEEAFTPRHAVAGTSEYVSAQNQPVLLLDLTALAAEVGQTDLNIVREVVVATLATGFTARSDDLFASGHCRHSERDRADEDRRRMEVERGGAVVTLINYPVDIDGVPLGVAWGSVRSASAWEVVDELKEAVAGSNRSLR